MGTLRDGFNPPEGGYSVLENGSKDLVQLAVRGVKIIGGVHRLAARPITRAILALGIPLIGEQYGFERKHKSGSSGTGSSPNWSVHATGWGVDVNAKYNWHDGDVGSPYRLPNDADARLRPLGFKTGIGWSSPDRMHVQPCVDLQEMLAIHRKLDGTATAPSAPVTHYEQFRHGAVLGTRQLDQGDAGDDVRNLQLLLNRWPNLAGKQLTQDGYYGPATTAKVRALQVKRKLTADGIAGRRTLGLLGVNVRY